MSDLGLDLGLRYNVVRGWPTRIHWDGARNEQWGQIDEFAANSKQVHVTKRKGNTHERDTLEA